jgi:hypothetical protein
MSYPRETYQKLDRAALWLLVGELCGAVLLLVLLLLMVIGSLISSGAFNFGYYTGQVAAIGIALIYGLAYLGNLVIGILGLYLYVSEKHEGYPGTGHLVNWTLLSATLVIVLVLIVAAFSSL